MRYAVRDCLPQEARYYTEHVVKWISPKAFTTRVPKNTGFTDVQAQYDAVTAVLDELRAKYPLLKGAGFASGDFKDPLLTNAAVAGASWGIGTSLVLCGIAVVRRRVIHAIVANARTCCSFSLSLYNLFDVSFV